VVPHATARPGRHLGCSPTRVSARGYSAHYSSLWRPKHYRTEAFASLLRRGAPGGLLQLLAQEMLLWCVKQGSRQCEKDFSGDVSLETTQDLPDGKAFRGAPLDVRLRSFIADEPGHCDSPKRDVAAPIPAAVEPVTSRTT
jgi:hypothetical protein